MITLAQYADILLHAINVKEGEILKDLFALEFFQDGNRQNTDGKANVTEEALKSVPDVRAQRLQSDLLKCDGFLGPPWLEIATNHFIVATRLSFLRTFSDVNCVSALSPHKMVDRLGCTVQQLIKETWTAMNTLIIAFLRLYSSLQQGRWCSPTLVMVLSNYRRLSVLADEIEQKASTISTGKSGKQTQTHLEECARQLNKAFSACISDRSSEEAFSRKWATYEIVGLVFRGYFKLRSLGLCRNILRAIGAADLPDFERFPRAQRVTFKYYVGVLAFLNEDYSKAEVDLDYAFKQCHKDAHHNQEMILRYLVPCRLLRGIVSNDSFLSTFPKLSTLYGGFIKAIKTGDVRSYDTILETPVMERGLVQIGTYLAIERAREICLRGLLKRVYLSKDCNSRIPLMDFHHALRFVGVELELLETEWLVASQIAKGYLRGYISHSHMTAVLSSQNPFPKLNTITTVTLS
ncbi:protein CSN12 [Meira miltonrushii]|uniref:Protein CSN12 n=1 Tax=Meira miltonrushii TaxID=1280837 RepID=A0A316VDN4_9BASI|nr:protein CSN12 [Meira miltonrushii]PWN35787.1 protein CSN12 [Meira miltonrushii]